MGSRREPGHVEPDFGKDHRGDDLADSGHRLQKIDVGSKGFEDLAQPRLHVADRGLQGIDLAEMQLQDEPVVLSDPAMEGLEQALRRGLQASFRGLEQLVGVFFSRDDGIQNRPSANAEHIADQASNLEIGVLEGFLDPECVLSDLLRCWWGYWEY